MPVPAEKSRVVRFGLFEVDLQEAELRKSGIRIKLQEQPFQILTMLLERPGQTVSREELRAKLWPADTFVDFDHSLNSSIKKLREALGDDSENPRFIETLHRRGYRFIAPVDGARTLAAEQTVPAAEPAKPIPAMPPHWKEVAQRWKWAVVVFAVLVVLLGYWLRPQLPPPRVIASRELTNDGLLKTQLVTDGGRIYFLEDFNTAPRIVQVSVTGGETAGLDVPVTYANVQDVSRERSELLVTRGPNSSFWSIPLPAGPPLRLGDVSGQCGVWAPNGKLVYAKGKDFYIAEHDGANPRKFATAPDEACRISFSPDGTRFRFTAEKADNWSSALWEARADGSNMHPVFPGWNNPPNECCGHWTPDGKYYVFQSTRDNVTSIWIVRERFPWWRKASREPVQLAAGPLELLKPLPSLDGKKLFALGRHRRAELVQYDAKSGEFVPYLGGISAGELGFSLDGQWVAYTSYPDGSLWRSGLDGSDRLQLTSPPMQAALAHWSPDGQQIAFSGRTPGKPWRTFLISKDGGSPQAVTTAASTDEVREADPTWSPDGKTLAFGHLDLLDPDQTFIAIFDAKTHRISELPGSRRIFAPRWSPDGRYILAETYPTERMMLYDVKNKTWQSVDGTKSIDFYAYLTWSHDSAYVYFEGDVGDEDKYYRVRIKDSKLEELIDKKMMMRRYLGQFGASSWTGLGPGDTPLFVRDVSTQEIYALDLDLP